MSENTAGLFNEPHPSVIDLYEQRPDGKWYYKARTEESFSDFIRNASPERKAEVYEEVMDEANAEQETVMVRGKEKQLVDFDVRHPHGNLPVSGVGDVNSDEKGSGARYNEGKPPMSYIPLRQQLIVWRGYKRLTRNMRRVIEELIRFEQGEVPMWNVVSLLSLADLNSSTYVWEYGAKKYAAFNWAKGMQWSIPLACISRHMQAILGGEELDSESGCTHWGHVVCNILMLEHYEQFYKEGDDRPSKECFNVG